MPGGSVECPSSKAPDESSPIQSPHGPTAFTPRASQRCKTRHLKLSITSPLRASSNTLHKLQSCITMSLSVCSQQLCLKQDLFPKSQSNHRKLDQFLLQHWAFTTYLWPSLDIHPRFFYAPSYTKWLHFKRQDGEPAWAAGWGKLGNKHGDRWGSRVWAHAWFFHTFL